jgi:DNA-directed RNA polymerase specialized sigma24 family protein
MSPNEAMQDAPGKPDGRLTRESFDALLAALGADHEEAARRYRGLHQRLAFFFTHRQFVSAEALADEVLNRIAQRIHAGEPVGAVEAYAYGVARHVAQEQLRRDLRNLEAENAYTGNILRAHDTSIEESMQAAMEECLKLRAAEERGLLLAYYSSRGQELIESRKTLAASMTLTPGALRKRIFRLRSMVEDCVRARLSVRPRG